MLALVVERWRRRRRCIDMRMEEHTMPIVSLLDYCSEAMLTLL